MKTTIINESNTVTKALLTCGAVLAPLFYVIVLLQMATRDGFDITRHAISSLSLGDMGWIQIANFIVTGVLAVLLAIGLRRVLRGGKAGTWAPLLIGVYGLGIMLAGVFPPDAALGFPPGAPEGMAETVSTSAALHSLGFFTAFSSLTATCFVVARRFFGDKERNWGMYSIVSGIASPLLVILGMTVFNSSAGICFALAGAVGFGWLSAVAVRLLTRL